jgi:hypothetical protein
MTEPWPTVTFPVTETEPLKCNAITITVLLSFPFYNQKHLLSIKIVDPFWNPLLVLWQAKILTCPTYNVNHF